MSARHETLHDNLFTGKIGAEYDFLTFMCPHHALLAKRLGETVAKWKPDVALKGVEIGCGTGVSTLPLLAGRHNLTLTAIDAAPAMLDQARESLADYVQAGRVDFKQADALEALKALPSDSLDLVTSNYAIHNFLDDYRSLVLAEIHRVLKKGGLFINGDRYAMDDRAAHLLDTQETVRRWFKLFREIDRLDLLEDWVVHFYSDESEDHIMHFTPSMERLKALGFSVTVDFREGVDTLVRAVKA
ncbi:class I SAM-dependent methyltransferase [Methylocystis parvus]|uniref:Class I SAM-dependent methyltransferase n=1 Tax=Methylocystis parvus TaxID=134 RepID=A0A6B8MCM2_9HYPH|nr:class I SAM-dependent methyltransferase [Methylocystis parvus]QGM98400.1 class I SAM-dependent methyltransferase [Methylocystis parvus]WBK01267.1 methyltransferase domain-containing protein [Methylocystis parvus OBBP]